MRSTSRPRQLLGIASMALCHGAGVLQSPANAAAVALPSAPSGFSGQPGAAEISSLSAGALAAGQGGNLLEGFNLVTSLSGTYDSNVTRSPGQPLAPIQDDFILSLGGNVGYLSKASEWTFGANYRGSYNSYFSQTEFNGYNQGGGLVANYDVGRLSASFTAGADIDQGSNQNYSSEFVKRTNYQTGLTTRYRLSSKTSLQGNIGQSFSTASGDFGDTESVDVGASALWKYSPLTELGPGVRYTYRSGSSQTGRSSFGPSLNVNYKLSTKVAMTSRVGMDFASYDDGGSADDPAFSASVGLNYEASKLWGMNFTLYRDTQADPSLAGGFTEVTSFRLGYHRKLRRAILNLGAGYDLNRSELPSGVAGGDGADRNYFNLDASVGMPIFSNSCFGNVFLRYVDQSAGAVNSWDSFQAGFGISRSF